MLQNILPLLPVKMRIAFLHRFPQPIHPETRNEKLYPHIQSALYSLAEALVKQGHEVAIFGSFQTPEPIQGVVYQNIAQLPRFAKTNPLDVFVLMGDEKTLKLGIPAKQTLWWGLNDLSELWDEAPDLRATLAKYLACKADKILTTSQWQANKLSEIFQIPREHFFVLPLGINPAQPASHSSTPRIIYSAPPDRGLAWLLEIFPIIKLQIPTVELHIYCDFKANPCFPVLDQDLAEALIEEDQSDIFYHGALPHQTLMEEYAKGGIWVYPEHPNRQSQFWTEINGIQIREAQAAGLPVVSLKREALLDFIQPEKTGFLANDPIQLKDIIIDLFHNEEKYNTVVQESLNYLSQHLNWEQVATQFTNFFSAELPDTKLSQAPFTSSYPAPKLSIIMPTYNRARNLAYALESLTKQDFEPFEVIICDDGSNDQTTEVVMNFKGRLNIRYRYQMDKGFRAAAARNMGLSIARGEVIVFMDSDLVVPETFLSEHWKALQKNDKVAVNSYVYRMLEEKDEDLGLPPEQFIPKHMDNLKGDSRDRYQLFERNEPVEETYYLDSNALSMKRKDIESFGGFDPKFIGWGHEDTELGYRIATKDFFLVFLKEGAAAYHIHHVFSEKKEEERAKNWNILTTKYGIKNWYYPLGKLEIEAIVHLGSDSHLLPLHMGEFELKLGQRYPQFFCHHSLNISSDGTLKSIQAIGPETVLNR